MKLDQQLEDKLIRFAQSLVNQQAAKVAVAPQAAASGYWFGGGNAIADDEGRLYLVGRYRNFGDSRTGLAGGQRGLELAVFRSEDGGANFEKTLSWSKADLDLGSRRVLSIEGSALHWIDGGVQLFVSSEKSGIGYPTGWEAYLKSGAGVWTIERLQADSVRGLRRAQAETVLASADLRYLHLKDPVAYDHPCGNLVLLFCTHPYCWSSSNTAMVSQGADRSWRGEPSFEFFPRGCTWDVAMTRATAVVDVPRVGAFRDLQVSLVFYDGGEALRNLDEHAAAIKRPRGYSCEELGGAAYFLDGDLTRLQRLSRYLPLFVSPWGTGSSRYVDVLQTRAGFFTSWQQSQTDLSQPLVSNFLSHAEAEDILA